MKNKLEKLSKDELLKIVYGRSYNPFNALGIMLIGTFLAVFFSLVDMTFGKGGYAHCVNTFTSIGVVYTILLLSQRQTSKRLVALIELLRKSNLIA